MTNLNYQQLKAALDECMEVGFLLRKIRIDETPTKTMNFVHIGIYIITPTLLSLFLMGCGYR